MIIYRSPFHNAHLPYTNAYTFTTSNPNKAPDSQVLLIDALTKKKITYGEWKRDTRRFATGLVNNGFKRGDVLAVFSFNQYDYSVVVFGPILLGGVTTTVNSAYTVDELVHQLQDSGATFIVAHPELLATAVEASKKVGIPSNRIFLFGDEVVDGFKPYSSIFPPLSTPESQLAQPVDLDGESAATTTALICYSSGTTGKSKGVELTHLNLCSNAAQVTPTDADMTPLQTVHLVVLPLYHIYGIQMCMNVGIFNASTSVVLPKFNPVDFLKAIQEFKVQTMNLVPPQILMLVKAPIVDQYDLSSVRRITSGAAPCPPELSSALVKKFPNIYFRQGYGMSELSPVSHVGLYSSPVHGSIGVVVPNCEVRLVDPETGKDAAPGQPGEIWVRGPNVMKGYRNNPKATAETVDKDGFLHTGDIATIDHHGHFFIVDRMKELIKYKGFQVAPAELEAILVAHPEIGDAAVIGVENKAEATEVPLAFVVRAPNSKITEQEVSDYVASKVAKHKKLRGGVRFVEVIPKSAAGKILRKDLRALVAQEKATKAKL
ncbi:putative fatty-acid--CoA ligase FadD10 [Actinomortierella wolfii]|nr:putative fatty-acid--CoA ligase FadD10 [Actinomortierella wolfii]